MWRFKAEQKRFSIGNVEVGGNPGEHPTVLIGTIFYRKQKIITDEEKGEFDRTEAERLIKRQEEFSDKTGNPHIVDVVLSTPTMVEKALDFVSDATDAPISIDGVTSDLRIMGLEHAHELGFLDRIVYNSIAPEYKEEELESIREAGLKSAIILAYNTKEFSSTGRVNTVRELLPIVNAAGIEKPLIDTFVLDIPSLGMACKALYELKNELGLPIGVGAHNAISTWRGLKRKMGRQALNPATATATAVAVAVGADFVLYGPIDHAEYMFPVVAMIDAAYGQLVLEQNKRLSRRHPIFKIG